MTRKRTAGYEEARDAGLLVAGADYEVALCMSGFTATPDAVNVADVTMDEFDGNNYVRYAATGVAIAYDSASDQWRVTCANGDGDEFGAAVDPGSEPPSVMVVILRIDGTDANDYILAWSDEGSFSNANGGAYGLTLPNDVLLFSGSAA